MSVDKPAQEQAINFIRLDGSESSSSGTPEPYNINYKTPRIKYNK